MRPKRFNPRRDYPLASKRPDLIKTPSGKSLQDITLEKVASGEIVPKEVRIRPETLELQAQVAEAHGRPQMAINFRRAAELANLSDEEILRIYNALRPRRSTKQELLTIAADLEKGAQARITADFIREATKTYERRGLLKREKKTLRSGKEIGQ
jgi:propanediol dehydratase small subunit